MAPSASVFEVSGTTRSISKSMVLPKPWQRGQAPNGLLKENSRGSGSSYLRLQALHSKRCEKAPAPWFAAVARRGFEDHLSGFAIGALDRIHDASANVGRQRNAVEQQEYRSIEIHIQQRLGGRELENLPILKQDG